jgi:hypothetical protein
MARTPYSQRSEYEKAAEEKRLAGYRRRQKEYRERLELKKPPAAAVRRRRCRNCKTLFLPTKATKVFCKNQCRIIFNRFGPGYDAIFRVLTRQVTRRIEEAAFDHTKGLRDRISELERRTEYLRTELERRTEHLCGLGERMDKVGEILLNFETRISQLRVR